MRTRIIAVVVAASLALAACGGDANESGPEGVAGPAPATTVPEPTPTDPAPPEPSPEPTATSSPQPPPAEPAPALALELTGLPVLDAPAVYEAWLILDGAPSSVGTFADPAVVQFAVATVEASAVVITIETDDDPAPSATHVLAGPVVDGRADLTVGDGAAIGVDFSTATGEYILATPTDGTGPPENERSGVWWTFIPRAQSLVLPELPAGWIYEGWQIIDGIPVTTGTFVSQFGAADDAAPYSGPQPGPPFPGEDFVANAPTGLLFPRDLRGTEVVISVEPVPDTDSGPFSLVPLRGVVPADAVDHVAYPVENVAAAMPSGTATLG